jgi:diguanylate cyclase (GGDEF)-like protein/PAS domain S-box-containing protein/putative nucleotidyltransferase with HDIG domain
VYNSKKALVDYEMGIIFEESRKIKWLKVNGFNIEDDNGSISGVLISFIDITEKKTAEQALLESEERYKYLFENSGVGIGYYTTDGTVISYNQKALENIGGKLEDYIGKSIRTLFPNEEAEIYFSRIKRAISSDKPQEYLDHLVMNSAHKWFSSVFTRVTGASGQIIGVQIASLDVSDRKYAEETAIDNAFKFQSLFDEISTGAAIYKVINDGEYGQDYIIQGFNKAALKGEGKELAEVIGKSLYDLRPNIDQYGLIPVFRSVWKTGKPEFFPSKIYIDEKFSNWYENRVYKLTTGEIVALFDDVTEKKRAEEDIEYLAYHDYLTDAYNRRYFENEYAEKNTGEYYPLAIVTGDLNGLKLINDSFGHHSGDLAIQQFATDIRKQIPKDAVLARIGGDEFAVLLTRNSEAEAKKLAGELQSIVQIQVKDNKGHDVDAMLTATFGYSSQSFPGQDMDELVKEVETFMNRRKFLENTSKRSNVIDAIMSTLFEKSEREQQHSIRVSSIATAIATEMGLDDATVAKTRVAGALHDIGKIGIDESILNKSERLSDQEWEVVKQHTIRSARILASVDEYLDIVPIVKAHHERIDGCGYPAGLTEKQIPIEAKIIAVADSFDAMTVSRPYRNAISKKLAAEELRRCAGSQFDPNIVEIFVNRVMANMEQGTSMT